jgi:2-phosphosulfolactate phosphatase
MQNTIRIQRVHREQDEQAEGIVIVIDVIRAFTVAAYAFHGGASSLWLVRTTEEALALRERYPDALLAGEINGKLIPGFELNNSPHVMSQADVRGKQIIQRTGAGTQGAVGARNATHLLVATLANARATAHYAAQLARNSGLPITFLPTATSTADITRNEDDYCADYMEAILTSHDTPMDLLNERITRLYEADRFSHWGPVQDEDFPEGDLEKILAVDRFDFVMVGERKVEAGVTYVEVEQRQVTFSED